MPSDSGSISSPTSSLNDELARSPVHPASPVRQANSDVPNSLELFPIGGVRHYPEGKTGLTRLKKKLLIKQKPPYSSSIRDDTGKTASGGTLLGRKVKSLWDKAADGHPSKALDFLPGRTVQSHLPLSNSKDHLSKQLEGRASER